MVTKSQRGRKKIFDEKKLHELKNLMRLSPTIRDAAAFFETCEQTVETAVKENFGVTFAQFREKQMVHTKMSLIRKAIQEATKDKPNTTLLIFALKNLANWQDKVENTVKSPEENKFLLAYEIRKKDDGESKPVDSNVHAV